MKAISTPSKTFEANSWHDLQELLSDSDLGDEVLNGNLNLETLNAGFSFTLINLDIVKLAEIIENLRRELTNPLAELDEQKLKEDRSSVTFYSTFSELLEVGDHLKRAESSYKILVQDLKIWYDLQSR
jgi:hypothetical protein